MNNDPLASKRCPQWKNFTPQGSFVMLRPQKKTFFSSKLLSSYFFSSHIYLSVTNELKTQITQIKHQRFKLCDNRMSECALLRVEGAIRQAEERATAAVLRRDKMSRARMTRSTYIYIYTTVMLTCIWIASCLILVTNHLITWLCIQCVITIKRSKISAKLYTYWSVCRCVNIHVCYIIYICVWFVCIYIGIDVRVLCLIYVQEKRSLSTLRTRVNQRALTSTKLKQYRYWSQDGCSPKSVRSYVSSGVARVHLSRQGRTRVKGG